jgi:tetratricopeptide (TPR) repeat protein
MKSFVIGAGLAGLLFIGNGAEPASAAMDQDALNAAAKICVNGTGGMAKAVESCTTVLENTSMSPQGTATLLYFRGSSLEELGRHQEAIADLDRAIGIYETANDRASWSKDAIAKIAASYSWRAQAKEALQRCDEAKLDFEKAAQTAVEISNRRDYERAARAACS